MIALAELGAWLARRAKAVPWQAWAILALFAAIGIYGCQQRQQGEDGALLKVERKQQEKADAAHKEVDRVLRGDRSRVMQFDRD
nr:hypothetical protein [Methylobacterium sp. ZNC0032]